MQCIHYILIKLLLAHLGMLSKSRGHVLRLAAVLHILFSFFTSDANPSAGDIPEVIDDIISEAAVQAAIDFTQLSCQQTAYIAGRGMLEEEVQKFDSSNY